MSAIKKRQLNLPEGTFNSDLLKNTGYILIVFGCMLIACSDPNKYLDKISAKNQQSKSELMNLDIKI